MSWTQDRPTQEGVYSFRRAKNKPPQQVTIKGDKVVFDSGNIKDLVNVKGQWLGPVDPSEHLRNKKRQEEKPGFFKRCLQSVAGRLVGAIGTIFLAILLSKLSITESKLVYVGERPPVPEIVETKLENGREVLHVKHSIAFRNYGLPSDHVDRIEIARDGLHPAPLEVKVLHVDGTELGWLERKEIKYEALIY
ncbi:MAG: hypothetical protein KJS98_14290, partial [Nitrospirae bacterium]|nr:hypothetical protein [Nitrospirota bacterium]